MNSSFLRVLQGGFVLISAATAVGQAHGLNLVLDYTHDTYIQTNPAAVASIEAAAAEIGAVISTMLPARSDRNEITIGKATVDLDWEISYTNPADGGSITIDPVSIPADEVRIFVGVRPITEPNDPNPTLGRGGPGFRTEVVNGYSIAPFFLSEVPQIISDLGNAVSQLETEANTNATRGGKGPTFGAIDLEFSGDLAGTPFSFPATVNFGIAVGNLWFDVDTDDDGSVDSNAALDAYWHWNHTTATATGKADFYSVAVHELLHSIGFGTSDNWDGLISDTYPDEWLGSHLIALRGTGENAIDAASGAHLAPGLMGRVFGSGSIQEAAMDPDLTTGTRKRLTDLDAAVLDDINWDVAYFLAGDYDDDGVVDASDYTVWRDNFGAAEGTLPNDIDGGQISQAQYDTWKSNFGRTLTTAAWSHTAVVPEPAGIFMALLGLGLGGLCRRSRQAERTDI